jgi:hypothetical protein
MKPLPSYAVFLTLIFFQATQAQKIVYSPPEKNDYNRFRFDVITKRDGKILVYKALYYGNPFHGQPSAAPRQSYSNPDPMMDNNGSIPGPNNSIEGGVLCVYDSNMHITTEKTLPLPRAISGIHFLVYDGFFYIFYQYLVHHTIYCMAAKVGMDGEILTPPIKMDSTTILDIHYESQIYSVINSEDKQHILLFRINIHNGPTQLKTILFDKDLRPGRTTNLLLYMEASQYLSEFNVDNEGNFIFIGMNGKARPHDEMQAVLFVQPRNSDSLYSTYFVPASISVDNIRLLVDNRNKKYILSSFYSQRPEADIKGLFCLVRDAAGKSADKRGLTVLSDNMLRAVKKSGIHISLNDYYIQDLHLRTDGSFTIEAQQLNVNPDHEFVSRWNYLPELKERVATEFAYFDPYENDHYYPWKLWHRLGPSYLNRFTYSSRGALITSFDSSGLVEWVNVINTPQLNNIDVSLGYKTIIANGLLYFLFNSHIRRNTFLSARSIDATGTLDTDSRFREDIALRDQDNDYLYFPRLAKTVDAGEVILPCRKGGFIYLAKISF